MYIYRDTLYNALCTYAENNRYTRARISCFSQSSLSSSALRASCKITVYKNCVIYNSAIRKHPLSLYRSS